MTESDNGASWIREQTGRTMIFADNETIYADNEEYYADGTLVFEFEKERY